MIEVRRVFDAPRALVWAAWTDPAQLPLWWGRRGWHIDPATLLLEPRPRRAPASRLGQQGIGERMTIDGVFDEDVAPEHMSFTHADARTVVTFTDLGGRTELIVRHAQGMSDPLRRRATTGIRSAFDRLPSTCSTPTKRSTHEHHHTHGHRRRLRDDLDGPTIDRARHFYGEVLGLEESTQWGELPAFERSRPAASPSPSADVSAFGQEALGQPAAARAAGRGHACRPRGARGPWGELQQATRSTPASASMAIFHDPDGNALMFHHRYAPRDR